VTHGPEGTVGTAIGPLSRMPTIVSPEVISVGTVIPAEWTLVVGSLGLITITFALLQNEFKWWHIAAAH